MIEKASKVRYTILAGVVLNVVINYMDRSNIAIAGTLITKELQLSNIQIGYAFSAFGWTYSILQIPGSIVADRIGVKKLYAATLVLWSLVTICLGFANSLFVLILLRVLIGALEAPSYPMSNMIVSTWFPEKERASAIGTYTSGQFIGLAFLAPALTFIQAYTGWRGLFFITGFIGVIWGIRWYFFYDSPEKHRRVNEGELRLIEEGGGLLSRKNAGSTKEKFNWKDLITVFSKKKLWGIYIGQFCLGGTTIFFLTWFPKYLVDFRKMDFIQSGIYAAIPFLFGFLGVLFSGFLSDYLLRKNVSASVARKTPIIFGLVLSSSIIFANYQTEQGWVIFYMALAFFGNGLASITWIFVSLLAPKRLMGLAGGTFNFIGGSSSILVPIAIGYLVQGGDFSPALVMISILAIIGAASYLFLVGKVERVEG